MDEFAIAETQYGRLDEGFGDQWDLMESLLYLLDFRIYLFYKYHQWLGPGNDMKNMLGLVVSQEEFEYKLTKASQQGLLRELDEGERAQLDLHEAAHKERLRHTTEPICLLQLFESLKLDAFEQACVTLAYAVELDGKYERLLAYLQDDITKKRPSIALAVQLFLPEGAQVEEYLARFEREGLFTALFDETERQNGNLRLRPMVTQYLSTGAPVLPRGLTLFDGAAQPPEHALIIGENLAHALELAATDRPDGVVNLCGAEGAGRRFQIRHLMAKRQERALIADLALLGRETEAVNDAALAAHLLGARLCFAGLEETAEDGTEAVSPALLEDILRAPLRHAPLFLVSKKPLHLQSARVLVSLPIPETDSAARLLLWQHFLAEVPLAAEVSLRELAAKFRFVPLQIRRAAEQAAGRLALLGKTELDNELLHSCCYGQVVHKLDALASRVRPAYGWDDLVLPAEQKAIMQTACAHVRHQHTVYNDWGFDQKISYGKGLSLLFAGAPGTGKTMCAQIIARQLNMQMYKINISQIISKYIGETEKNLGALFKEAKDSNCILFFDECDALFGKRSEVKDSHDRHANVEVAYLLQQIEEHDGVCILASNLTQNIDAAFMRRITYVVHFPFPDADARREIYLRMLPASAPVEEDVDWQFIAAKFKLSGGHIKNIVLSAAFMAAAEEKAIHMRHLLRAAVNEMKKNEIVVVREELREYADLLQDGGGGL